MDRRCCCKRRGCLIVGDDFNREPSTNLGSNWVEVLEDSDIYDNTLRIPAGGIVRTARKHPANHWTGIYEVKLVDLQHDNKYRLLFNYKDADNYYYLEYHFFYDSGDKVTLSLGSVSGGGDSTLQSSTTSGGGVGGDARLVVCRDLDGVYFGVDGADIVECTLGDNGGRYAGLESAGNGSARFDDFIWEEHYYTNHDCPPCLCSCEGYCLPEELTMTIVAYEDCCEPCNNPSCTLDGLESTGSGSPAGEGYWQFDFSNWKYLYSGGCMTTDQSFHLLCPFNAPIEPPMSHEQSQSGSLFHICDISEGQLQVGSSTGWDFICHGTSGQAAYPSEYTCNPLWFKFGPFQIWESSEDPGGDILLCTFEIHVTK